MQMKESLDDKYKGQSDAETQLRLQFEQMRNESRQREEQARRDAQAEVRGREEGRLPPRARQPRHRPGHGPEGPRRHGRRRRHAPPGQGDGRGAVRAELRDGNLEHRTPNVE